MAGVILLAIPVGLFIGLTLGALGGGGSILTVPALVYVLGQNAHGATTASLLIVGVTALAGMAAHLRAGRVDVRLGLVFGLLGVGGSYVGSRLSERVDQHVLLTAFSVLIVVAAVSMLRRTEKPAAVAVTAAAGSAPAPSVTRAQVSASETSRREVPLLVPAGRGVALAEPDWEETAGGAVVLGEPDRGKSTSLVRMVVAATVVGLLTGFFGVGGGFVVVPALVLAVGIDMPLAVGTSLLVIAVNSASALLSRLGAHAHIDLPLVVAFTAAAVAGSLAGSHVVSRTTTKPLVRGFAVLLILLAVYTAVRSLPHLF